jgi:hypothetical protein
MIDEHNGESDWAAFPKLSRRALLMGLFALPVVALDAEPARAQDWVGAAAEFTRRVLQSGGGGGGYYRPHGGRYRGGGRHVSHHHSGGGGRRHASRSGGRRSGGEHASGGGDMPKGGL